MNLRLDLHAQVRLDTPYAETLRQQMARGWSRYDGSVVEEDGVMTWICPAASAWSAHTVQLVIEDDALRVEVWADDWSSLTAILAALVSKVGPSALQRRTA